MKTINKMDFDNGTSSYVNQQQNYVNQPLSYVNYANSENCHYATLLDGGWTKNDYQNIQG